MKKLPLTLILIAAVVLSLAAAGCVSENNSAGGIDITNSDGTITHLDAVPERIALLNSNAGEILYMLGCADKVVGISQSIANNKEQAAMYPNAVVTGAWNEPNVEYLLNLNADLIIGYATSKPKNAEVLAAAGIPIVYIDCTKPATMAQDIIEVGKIAGDEDVASDIAQFYTEVMDKVAAAAASVDSKPTVYAESYTNYWGQGTDSGMGQLISLVGAQNIMTNAASEKVSDEWVVSSSPEVMVKLVNSMENAKDQYTELMNRDAGFKTISAVKNNKVWLIINDLTYGPRSCAAAVALFEMCHPGVLTDLTADGVLTEFNKRFGTEFAMDDLSYPAL